MLKLISPVSDVFRKDFEIDTTHLTTNPTSAVATQSIAEAGLWVQLNSDGTKMQAVRNPSGATATDAVKTVNSATGTDGEVYVQIWNQKGDYGMQALNKVTTLFLGSYEAITDKYAGSPAVGDYLTVGEAGTLAVADGAGDLVVAQCTKVNSTASTIQYVKFSSPFPLQ